MYQATAYSAQPGQSRRKYEMIWEMRPNDTIHLVSKTPRSTLQMPQAVASAHNLGVGFSYRPLPAAASRPPRPRSRRQGAS